MIQRKQTIFLFLSFIVLAICLCMPIGLLEPSGMRISSKMTNLWIVDGNGVKDFKVWPLFATLLITLPLHLFVIFDYKNRKRQILFCSITIFLVIAWHLAYLLISQFMMGELKLHFEYGACLPFVSLILLILARNAIKSDEALVRAADRIR